LKDVGKTIVAHDALFLPSLMESYSGVYSEALLYERPIFTSNYDFATALLDNAAFYFDPLKPAHIAEVIEHAITHPELIEEKQLQARKLAASMPDWNEIAQQFSGLLNSFS
jgi:glycosyltransferase involved in cell wall biosynthesis